MDSIHDPEVLLSEDNIVSLRTAIIVDDGNVASVSLLPRPRSSISEPTPISRKEILESASEFAWLYRHLRSPSEEERLMSDWPGTPEQNIKPMLFKARPKLGLIWSDSGHSVAVVLNGEPWAFIDEETRQGYSKGLLNQEADNPWDQARFDKIFGEGLGK